MTVSNASGCKQGWRDQIANSGGVGHSLSVRDKDYQPSSDCTAHTDAKAGHTAKPCGHVDEGGIGVAMPFQSVSCNTGRAVIALTGGPGGCKTSLIEDLRRDPCWAGRFVCLPEAVQYARFANISPSRKLFQRLAVHLQMALEDSLDRALGPEGPRLIVCHRGSLDPLAFWRQRGWPEAEFFHFTGTTRDQHYARYAAVLHLVTAADGVPREYTRWPRDHRPEKPAEAIQLDRWLQEAWEAHPNYIRLDNTGRDWRGKSEEARQLLCRLFAEELSLAGGRVPA